jgi:hypothetical protein
MSDGRRASKIVGVVASVIAALSIAGLVILMAVSAFVLDKYNAYGEVAIPGKSTVYLPAGEVAVNFHVLTNGRGTAVPPLHMNITPPPGVSDPEVSDDLGASVSVNNDVHRRVWSMRVKGEGGYAVSVDGPVNGYIEPRLAFGDNAGPGWPMWVLTGVALFSADLAVAAWWFRRGRRGAAEPVSESREDHPLDPYTPTDEAVRLEQLKTIAALRDSGALTDKEFADEKRRILKGR